MPMKTADSFLDLEAPVAPNHKRKRNEAGVYGIDEGSRVGKES